jgi:hypothetical protein
MQKTCLQRLKTAYRDAPGTLPRSIKLPSGIRFEDQDETVRLELTARGITANMQEDAGAFEGWSLAFHRWCKVKVELGWEILPENATPAHLLHYQRFLYRVAYFKGLFPEWFAVESSLEKELSNARALGQSCVLNVEDKERDITEKPGGKPERRMELMLLKSDKFAEHYGFPHRARDIHFPVGLFEGVKRGNTRIFPGGAANIDLVCLDDEVFWIFELKAEENYPVGILTESFFYASVIRDALRGGHFRFVASRPGAQINPEVLKSVTQIEAVMLGHKIHPLLDSGLISILNDAVEGHWNADLSRVRVHFRADQLLSDEPDLRIAPVE